MIDKLSSQKIKSNSFFVDEATQNKQLTLENTGKSKMLNFTQWTSSEIWPFSPYMSLLLKKLRWIPKIDMIFNVFHCIEWESSERNQERWMVEQFKIKFLMSRQKRSQKWRVRQIGKEKTAQIEKNIKADKLKLSLVKIQEVE